MSEWVLSKIKHCGQEEFQRCTRALQSAQKPSYYLAELHDLLAKESGKDFIETVDAPPEGNLPAYYANYVAAMVETAAHDKGVRPPGWVRRIPPLTEPVMGSTLEGLRLYLLTNAPPPFRRRNIFIDASVGQRV